METHVPHDNPSPEMRQMRADAIKRMEKANETVEKALGDVQRATSAIEACNLSASTAERKELENKLRAAQEAYLHTYEQQKIAYSDAATYFEPIEGNRGI